LGDEVRKQDLQFGDLVFFRTARYAPITHVGIYIGEGLFANAACSRGVTVASLSSKYWSEHYIGARRLFTNSSLASSNAVVNSSTMADEVEGTTDR
jgi:peptidoglycan DL-endopeptidase CwlO